MVMYKPYGIIPRAWSLAGGAPAADASSPGGAAARSDGGAGDGSSDHAADNTVSGDDSASYDADDMAEELERLTTLRALQVGVDRNNSIFW